MPTASTRSAAASSRCCRGRRSTFPLEETLAAITPATRLVFVTSPGNPTGVLIARDDIRALARALPPRGAVFVDEAYAEFTDEHFLGELDAHPNVVVGRTFAKAQGLAGLRDRRGRRRAGDDRAAAARRCRPTASTSPRRSRSSPRSAIGRISRGIASRCARSREIVYAACRRLGLELLAELRELRAGPRRRRARRRSSRRCARAASSSATARRSRAAPAASASPPASSSTPRRAWRALEEVLCAAR